MITKMMVSLRDDENDSTGGNDDHSYHDDNDGSDNVMAMIAARSKGVNKSVAYINVDLNIT